MAPSPTLQERAVSLSSLSSSASSSDACAHSNTGACEKPVSTTGLQIGLGIGIPVFVVFVGLGFLMLWRYKKNKKEAMEHDPDFDENGEATALPDFPAFSDPFDNRFSLAPKHNTDVLSQQRSVHDVGSMSTRNFEDAPVDGFVLPYHHNTSSKASLEEFARHLVDHHLSARHSQLRYTSVTPAESTHSSPQKSNLRYETATPVGRLTKEDYKTLPNQSVTSLNAEEYYNTKEEISEDTNDTSKLSSDGFGVEYENEGELAINSVLPSQTSPKKRTEKDSVMEDYADASDSPEPFVEKEHLPESNGVIEDIQEIEESHDASDEAESDEELDEARQVAPIILVKSPFSDHSSLHAAEASDANGIDTTEITIEDTTEHPSLDPGNSTQGSRAPLTKSPRLSAFDLLKNVSDDEGEGGEHSLDPEQEEELARMKSVYKVYFDRSNSIKNATGEDGAFKADSSQPLPKLDIDRLQINDQLKGDTKYDKRKTTTSSIYDEAPIFAEQNQPHSMPHHQFLLHPYAQLPAQQVQPPPPPPPPLKTLPSASEIRHSTIETFTDYQPKGKGKSHANGETSASSTPYLSQDGSFATLRSPTQMEMGSPILDDNNTPPTPHQLSRTSVVMLNPVEEFKSQRKFKPAGSLPAQPGQRGYMNDSVSHSNEDLIPGNRKSAVRRMMNTNF